MDIRKLYKCFSDDDKKQLKQFLEEDEWEFHDTHKWKTTIKEWCKDNNASERLTAHMNTYSYINDSLYIENISIEDFINDKNTPKDVASEFLSLIRMI
jgi:hypothetical protein